MKLTLEGDKALAANLDATPRNISRALVPGMVKVGLGLRGHLAQNELSGQSLNVRTGHGRRSAFYRVETGNDQSLLVIVGNDLRKAKYMRAQDEGAVITPKRAANLTIPIGPAMTPKGVARFTAREVISSPRSFGYVGTFTRNGVLFGNKGNDEAPVPLFALVKRVTLRAVGFLARTLNEKRGWAEGVLGDIVDTELKK